MAILFFIVINAFIAWMGVQILNKAGLSVWWALSLVVPLLNLVMIWAFAFSRWPALDGPPPAPPRDFDRLGPPQV